MLLDILIYTDRLLKLYPGLGMFHTQFQRPLSNSYHLGTEQYCPLLHNFGQGSPTTIEFSYHILLGNFDLIEDNFILFVTGGCVQQRAGYPSALAVNQKQGYSILSSGDT